MLGDRIAWFGVLYCTGAVYPCWWDPRSQVYTPVSVEEEAEFGLAPLHQVIGRITEICKLELFSTEIAYMPEGLFVAVDYVNDQIDLRLQSKAADGAPDFIVHDIADRLAFLVEVHHPQG